jgi:hypothetical protein
VPKGEWQKAMREDIPNSKDRARAVRLADGPRR